MAKKSSGPNPQELLRLIVVGGVIILIGIAIMARADFFILLILIGVLFFAWKGPLPAIGNLQRTRVARTISVAQNIQPKLGNLYRSSPYIAGKVLVGKIEGMNTILQESAPSRIPLDEEGPGGRIRTGASPKKSPLHVLYEFTISEGRWPNKTRKLYMIKRSDLLVVPHIKDAPLSGDITVQCGGFLPCMTHLVPDTWTLDEFKDVGVAVTRSLVSVNAAEDILDDYTTVVDKAKNSDERHLKEMDKIREGGGNPAA